MAKTLSQRAFILLAATLLIVLALLIWSPLPQPLPGYGLPPGGAFTLESASGPVSLQDFQGKVVILYFGYTYCPDICPTALAAHTEALRLLSPAEAARVAVLFVSVDPERDTPAHLKDYAAFFHPAFIGLTGMPIVLQELTRRYGVFYAKQPSGSNGAYSVDHTADSFVIDRDGQLVAKLAHGTTAETTAASLRRWLQ